MHAKFGILFFLVFSSIGSGDTTLKTCAQKLAHSRGGFVSIDQVRTIKLLTFNVLRLRHREGVSKIIAQENPDIVVLQEVDSLSKLKKMNLQNLGGRYRPLLFQGNSSHHLAFLIRKSLPLEVEARSYAKEMWIDPFGNQEKPLFARDLPTLIFRSQGFSEPILIVMGVHLKSKANPDKNPDQLFKIRRKAEVDKMAEIAKELQSEFDPSIFFIITGDFNGNTATDSEFESLRKIGINAFEAPWFRVPANRRHSYVPFDEDFPSDTLDGIWLLGEHSIENCYVVEKSVFQNRAISDHRPIVATFNFGSILEGWIKRKFTINRAKK